MADQDPDERFVIEGDPEDALRSLMHFAPEGTLTDADKALRRAWLLGDEDYTDEVMDEFETLLPTLVAAGYAERDADTWNFTPKGVARAEVVAPER